MYLPPFAKKISHSAHILFKLPHPFQNSFISYLHSFWEYRSDLLVLRRIYIPCKGFRQLCHKTGLFLFMRFCSRRPQPPKQKKWKLGKWTIYFTVPPKLEDACAYFFFKWGGQGARSSINPPWFIGIRIGSIQITDIGVS